MKRTKKAWVIATWRGAVCQSAIGSELAVYRTKYLAYLNLGGSPEHAVTPKRCIITWDDSDPRPPKR